MTSTDRELQKRLDRLDGGFWQAVVRINRGEGVHLHSQVFMTKEEGRMELGKNKAYEIVAWVSVCLE